MNRHERRRRAAATKSSPLASLASLAEHWPQVDADRIGERRGEVIIGIFRHAFDCPCLKGFGLQACTCAAPSVSFHVQPSLQ